MQYRHSSPANAHEQCHQTVGLATSPVGCFHAPWNGRRRSVEGSSRYSALEIQNFCLHPVALWPCSKQVFFASLQQIHKKCCSAEKAKMSRSCFENRLRCIWWIFILLAFLWVLKIGALSNQFGKIGYHIKDFSWCRYQPLNPTQECKPWAKPKVVSIYSIWFQLSTSSPKNSQKNPKQSFTRLFGREAHLTILEILRNKSGFKTPPL